MNGKLKIMRYCTNCQHYTEETMMCKMIGKVERAYWPVCSWFKVLPEIRRQLRIETQPARIVYKIGKITKEMEKVMEGL